MLAVGDRSMASTIRVARVTRAACPRLARANSAPTDRCVEIARTPKKSSNQQLCNRVRVDFLEREAPQTSNQLKLLQNYAAAAGDAPRTISDCSMPFKLLGKDEGFIPRKLPKMSRWKWGFRGLVGEAPSRPRPARLRTQES